MFSVSFHGVSKMLNASTPFCRTPAFCGSSCVTPSSVDACNRIPCSGTTSSVPRCLFASRNKICGTVQALAVFAPGPERVMMNCCWPSVLPVRFKVMTRPASVFNSVQWLNAAPLMDSTSKPSGMTKLNLKIPARVIFTVAVEASTVRSSPSESVSCVSTRTSGSTADALSNAVACVSE